MFVWSQSSSVLFLCWEAVAMGDLEPTNQPTNQHQVWFQNLSSSQDRKGWQVRLCLMWLRNLVTRNVAEIFPKCSMAWSLTTTRSCVCVGLYHPLLKKKLCGLLWLDLFPDFTQGGRGQQVTSCMICENSHGLIPNQLHNTYIVHMLCVILLWKKLDGLTCSSVPTVYLDLTHEGKDNRFMICENYVPWFDPPTSYIT